MPGHNGILQHTLKRPEELLECASVLDIGAGIRPFSWYKPARHICVEPYEPYCLSLVHAGYTVFCGTAEEALAVLHAEAILLLDVIEHMDKEVGQRVIAMAKTVACRQVVLYTPNGFLPQEGDAWGLGGDEWQRHRSGWTPEEFAGWTIQREPRGFFALWNA